MIRDERAVQGASASGRVFELHPRNGPGVAARQGSATSTASEPDSEKLFRLEVMIDMQRERELLYKVTLVIEAIATLMLLRECALWWFA
ncbi:MAG: hypothetical protein ACKOWD_02380 [Rhodoferax sp.]